MTYRSSAAGVTVDLSLKTAQVSTGNANGDILSGIENVIGSLGDSNKITGDANANVIAGGAFNDVLDGGKGIDTVDYSNLGGAATVDLAISGVAQNTGFGFDTLTNFENITGSSGDNDTLSGDKNANVILGLGGNDTIEGRGGADTLDGGTGFNTVSYASSAKAVTVTLGLWERRRSAPAATLRETRSKTL